ncbi:M48 family peptidase [Halocatena pleomorpha]|uniref:M48 family peptidase n=1 Tax=Halocatena pleomorpha TaxID=1785090 RepID=A0A3P3R4N2_9EURY|nr:M48 family peptidase [Halocatena pleomorpha]
MSSVQVCRHHPGRCRSDGLQGVHSAAGLLQVDYLVVHELAHLTEQHHGRAFWQLVGEYVPDYKATAHWLEVNSVQLIFSDDDL